MRVRTFDYSGFGDIASRAPRARVGLRARSGCPTGANNGGRHRADLAILESVRYVRLTGLLSTLKLVYRVERVLYQHVR